MRLVSLVVVALFGCKSAASLPTSTLLFGERAITTTELSKAIGITAIEVHDPHYDHAKHFDALPMARVLALGFAGRSLAGEALQVKATDGYAISTTVAKLSEPECWLAIADRDVPGWEPIGDKRANPGPFFLVWTRPTTEADPWPYQIASIDIASFESRFPLVIARTTDTSALSGFALFKERCLSCHAINRQGGHVGPDLNVPQSIVEYRPAAQIKAYIKNPLTFRYGNMPPHPDLSDAQLDALIAYFTVMKEQKADSP